MQTALWRCAITHFSLDKYCNIVSSIKSKTMKTRPYLPRVVSVVTRLPITMQATKSVRDNALEFLSPVFVWHSSLRTSSPSRVHRYRTERCRGVQCLWSMVDWQVWFCLHSASTFAWLCGVIFSMALWRTVNAVAVGILLSCARAGECKWPYKLLSVLGWPGKARIAVKNRYEQAL